MSDTGDWERAGAPVPHNWGDPTTDDWSVDPPWHRESRSLPAGTPNWVLPAVLVTRLLVFPSLGGAIVSVVLHKPLLTEVLAPLTGLLTVACLLTLSAPLGWLLAKVIERLGPPGFPSDDEIWRERKPRNPWPKRP